MLHLRTLGTFDLRGDDGHVIKTVVAQPKRAALVLVLAAAGRGEIVRRDTLLALFWPERDTESARAALRRALHFLRRELGDTVIVGVGGEALRLEPGEIHVDLWELETAAKTGDHAASLALAGMFAPGLHVSGAPEFSRWLDERREAIRRDVIRAASAAFSTSIANGDTATATLAAQRLTEIAPDEESSWRALVQAHRASADMPAAIGAYNKYAAYLRDELNIDPSPDLESLASAPLLSPHRVLTAIPPARQVVAEIPVTLETPAQPAAVYKRASWRAAALLFSIAISVIALAWSASRDVRPPASDTNAPSVVAVLPFFVSGTDVQYLGDGIVDLLGLRLDVPGTSRSVDSRTILSRFAARPPINDSTARGAAAELKNFAGATRIVIGSVTQIGVSVELAARLLTSDDSLITVATARAETERDLPAAVDDLARGILTAMVGRRVELTAATTQSLDALKAFIAGEREFRSGHFNAAIVSYRSAIKADTTFGRAYARLSAALSEATNVQARDAMLMAVAARRFADQLPPVERLLVLGHAEFYAGSAQAAEQYFSAATSAAPENVEAWLGLGESIFHGHPIFGRPAAPSRSPFARALALDPDNPTAIEHLTRLDAWEGYADSLAHRASQLKPGAREDVRGREIAAIAAFATADDEARKKLIKEIAASSPRDAWRIAWATAHYARAFDAAEWLLANVARQTPSSRRRGFLTVARAHFRVAAGRIPEAYILLDSARAEAPIEALCTRAQLLLLLDSLHIRAGERGAVVRELGAWSGALPAADSLFEEEIEDDGASIRAYYLARLGAPLPESRGRGAMVNAVLAAARGDTSTALRIARDAHTRMLPMRRSLRYTRSLDRLLIAEWLLASGDRVAAADWASSVPEDRGYDVLLIGRARTLAAAASGVRPLAQRFP